MKTILIILTFVTLVEARLFAEGEPKALVQVLAHAVAVKNVCAWPNLKKLADRSVVATIFNQPCHGLWEGDIDCWATIDGGKSWQFRGRPAPHEPTTNRMLAAAGTNAKGELIVLASGYSHRNPPPPEGKPTSPNTGGAPMAIWVCLSADYGKTWTRAEGVELPSKSRSTGTTKLSDRLIPFGDVSVIGEGKLGVCLYAWEPVLKTHDAYFFTSADDGRTWKFASVIAQGGLNETTLLRLRSGDLLACGRTMKDQHLELLRSTDNGRSWKQEQQLTGPLEHPAHLIELSDGRVLLTYGNRSLANWKSKWSNGSPGKAEFPKGIGVRISADSGRTWSEPERIASFDGDGGYPSTVELPDGRLLTGFYAKRTADYEGYQMATVTWRLQVQTTR